MQDDLIKLQLELRKLTTTKRIDLSNPESVRREINFIKNYGKYSKACICKLWRGKCTNSHYCISKYKHILDHGHMHFNGTAYTYIAEPYLPLTHQKEAIAELVNKHNLQVTISTEESSWFPGATTALIFRRKDGINTI